MIALACGIHEAARRIKCPVCPRVLAELRAEPVGVFQAFSPIGQGKARRKSAATRADVVRLAGEGKSSREVAAILGLSLQTVQTYGSGLFATQRKKVDRDEVVRRAKRGESAAQIAKALGICDTTAQRYGKGHFAPRTAPRTAPPSKRALAALTAAERRDAIDRAIRRGWSTTTISKRLGIHRSRVVQRRTQLRSAA